MVSLSDCYSSLFDGLNAEVQIRWLQMVVRNMFYPDLPRVRAFLHKHVSAAATRTAACSTFTQTVVPVSCLQTSRMYTVPLYEDLVAGVMKCVAVEIFYQTQRRLHPNLRRTLQQILFQTGTAPTNQNGQALPIVPPSPPTSPPTSTQSQPAAAATTSNAAAGTTAAIALRDVNVSA